MGNPHILVIPYPAQGHVIPLMELSEALVKHGFKITFVNTDFNHQRVMNSLENKENEKGQIRLVSIPDGLEVWEDRSQLGKLTEAISEVMPGKLKKMIEEINGSDGGDEMMIKCVIADISMGWALDVAREMGIRGVGFWTASASLLALSFSIQKLIDDGIVDNDGTPIQHQMIHLSPAMPAMKPTNFVWACIGDLATQKIIFNVMIRNNIFVKSTDWLICNSTYDLEPAAFTLAPQILPIGPLISSKTQIEKSAANFWPEDSKCLKWLDQHPPGSVIYVAFGSFTVMDQTQFQELALGLELCNRPFLWVVRPNITEGENDAYLDGFKERVARRGQMVGWAPQLEVLSHPSIGCFMSHCGWNSTIEGLSNGLPFLCWPYFADQFLNETYICDVWKIGLSLKKNESGIITKEEIRRKVKQLIGNGSFGKKALEMKEMALNNVREGGCSYNNFNKFIEWMNI